MKHYWMTALCMTALVGLFTAGCATGPEALSDEEQIMKQVESAMAAVQAKDLDVFEKYVAESFYAGVIGDRDALRDYLEAADSMGFLDDIEIDMSNIVITVESGTATMSPVIINGIFGTERLRFEGEKQNGVWLLTGLSPTY